MARSLAAALLSTTLSVLPVFLVGALAVLLRRDLSFDQTELGAAAAGFYASSAVASIPAGRLAQRLGPENAMAISAVGSAAALVSIAALAHSWASLFGLLVAAGVTNALAQPAANASIARDQPPDRQGTAFGILQAAIPLSTLLAGLAVPVIGLRVGWRWAFAGAALGAVPVLLHWLRRAPRTPAAPRVSPVRRSTGSRAPLIVLAVAGGFAAAPSNAMGAFYVDSAVAHGTSAGAAGLWLAIGSACGIAGRLLWGWLADRTTRDPLSGMVVLLVAGSAGFSLLGSAVQVAWLALGTLVAFGAGWAWKGLYNLTVVNQNRDLEAAALGVSQAGVFGGSVAGPLVFGALTQSLSYSWAWNISGLMLLVAAVLVWTERRMFERTQAA